MYICPPVGFHGELFSCDFWSQLEVCCICCDSVRARKVLSVRLLITVSSMNSEFMSFIQNEWSNVGFRGYERAEGGVVKFWDQCTTWRFQGQIIWVLSLSLQTIAAKWNRSTGEDMVALLLRIQTSTDNLLSAEAWFFRVSLGQDWNLRWYCFQNCNGRGEIAWRSCSLALVLL